jgi:hypothetical protein
MTADPRSATPETRLPADRGGYRYSPVRSCVVDGEAIVCDDDGLAVFNLIRGRGGNGRAILCAFDLLEVNGEDSPRQGVPGGIRDCDFRRADDGYCHPPTVARARVLAGSWPIR